MNKIFISKSLFKKIFTFFLVFTSFVSATFVIISSISSCGPRVFFGIQSSKKSCTLSRDDPEITFTFIQRANGQNQEVSANWKIQTIKDDTPPPEVYLNYVQQIDSATFTISLKPNAKPLEEYVYKVVATKASSNANLASTKLFVARNPTPTPIQEPWISLNQTKAYLDTAGTTATITATLHNDPGGNIVNWDVNSDGSYSNFHFATLGNTATLTLQSNPTQNQVVTIIASSPIVHEAQSVKITLTPLPTPWLSIASYSSYVEQPGEITIQATLHDAPSNEHANLSMSPNSFCSPPTGPFGVNLDIWRVNVNSLPTNGQNATVTFTASYNGATSVSTTVILIAYKTPWIILSSDKVSLSTATETATITADLHNSSHFSSAVTFDPISGPEASYASLVDNHNNTATLTLDTVPPNNMQCSITARYTSDDGMSTQNMIQVALIQPAVPWISLTSDVSYLQHSGDSANITTTFGGSLSTQPVSFECAPDSNVNIIDSDPTDGECILTLTQEVNVPIVVTVTATTVNPVGGDDITAIINITLAPPEPTPWLSMSNDGSYLDGSSSNVIIIHATLHDYLGVNGDISFSSDDTTWTNMSVITDPGNDPYAKLVLKDNSQRPSTNVTVKITTQCPNLSSVVPEHIEITVSAQETKTPWISVTADNSFLDTIGETAKITGILHDGPTGSCPTLVSNDSTTTHFVDNHDGTGILTLDHRPPVTTEVIIKASYTGAEDESVHITLPAPSANAPEFGDYEPAMYVGDSQKIEATVVDDIGTHNATISVSGNGDGTNWHFDSSTDMLYYDVGTNNDIKLTVTATYNNRSSKIFITLIADATLPINNDFFLFDGNSVIVGYSANFINACQSDGQLNDYMRSKGISPHVTTLDLSNQIISGEQQVLSSQRPGYQDIANFYKRITNLILDNVTFTRWDLKDAKESFLGCYTFSGPSASNDLAFNDFSNVENLSLKNIDCYTKSAPSTTGMYVNIHTAYKLFSNMNFAHLQSLEMEDSNFSVQSQETQMPHSCSIVTCDSTFEKCLFPQLNSLSIQRNIFASSDMDTISASSKDNPVITFSSTFAQCQFDSLDTNGFTLTDNIFVTSNMTGGHVSTCNNTFANSNFSSLTSLDLSNCIFAVSGVQKGTLSTTNIYTAPLMFANCNFSSLESIIITTTTFAELGTTLHDDKSKWAYQTFANCHIPVFTDLYLTDTSHQPTGDAFFWDGTFDGCYADDYTTIVTIHGYSSAPDWWTNGWLGEGGNFGDLPSWTV